VADKDNSSAHEDNPSPVTQNRPDRNDSELWAVLTGVNNAQVNPVVFDHFKIGKIAIPSKLMGYVKENSSFSEGEKSKVQQWYENKLKAPQDTLPQSYGKENIFSP
jgi:hypothetical protein